MSFNFCDLMIIDEDPYMAKAIYFMLNDLGLKIQIYQKGDEAIANCSDCVPQLFLIDCEAMDSEGLCLVSKILPMVESKASIVLMVSQFVTTETLNNLDKYGINKMVKKPLHKEELRGLIVQTMQEFNLEKKAS